MEDHIQLVHRTARTSTALLSGHPQFDKNDRMNRFSRSLAIAFENPQLVADVSNVAAEYNDAARALHIASVKAMGKVIALCFELSGRVEAEYPQDYKSGILPDYLNRTRLNIMQRLLELCMPGVEDSRVMALLLIQAHQEGYSMNIEEYLRKQGGLGAALATAQFDLWEDDTRRRYSSMGKNFLGQVWNSESKTD